MNIKVYSTTTCPWCTKVKDYLKSKGLEFENVDVSANREAAMEMVKKTQQMGVPVTEIDGEFVIGYDTAKIDELISKAE
jgi:glutaredoxin-like YruB-family protein